MQKSVKKLLIGAAFVGGIFLSSCTSYITEEQLATMQELRREEAMLKEQLKNENINNEKLERELKQLQAQIDDCAKKKAFVEDKLKQWPDVWGDK